MVVEVEVETIISSVVIVVNVTTAALKITHRPATVRSARHRRLWRHTCRSQ